MHCVGALLDQWPYRKRILWWWVYHSVTIKHFFSFVVHRSQAFASFSRFSFQTISVILHHSTLITYLPLTHFQDVLLLSSNISPIILTSPISLPSRLRSDRSIYCAVVFSFYRYLSLRSSLSISFPAACLCFMSISISPSFISVRAHPLMPAATHGKKHIFCHIAMSVKFRSCVCLYVSPLQGYFHHQIPFPLQTNTSAGRLADKREWESEQVCTCTCGCRCVSATRGRH